MSQAHTSVTCRITSGTATICLNRPAKRNALNAAVISELTSIINTLSADNDITLITLSGNGRSFCAGADIEHMRSMAQASAKDNDADAKKLSSLLKALYHCPHPLIATVQGHVYGGGLGLIACADLVIAEECTRFCFSEVTLGIIPATIAPFIQYKIGASQTLAHVISALPFSAATAKQINLIHHVTTPEQLSEKTAEICEHISRNSTTAMRLAKKATRQLASINDAHIEASSQWLADSRATTDAREGLTAFLEKRQPHWSL